MAAPRPRMGHVTLMEVRKLTMLSPTMMKRVLRRLHIRHYPGRNSREISSRDALLLLRLALHREWEYTCKTLKVLPPPCPLSVKPQHYERFCKTLDPTWSPERVPTSIASIAGRTKRTKKTTSSSKSSRPRLLFNSSTNSSSSLLDVPSMSAPPSDPSETCPDGTASATTTARDSTKFSTASRLLPR